MLVKLTLISVIFSFVFMRSSESRGIESLSLVGESYSDSDMFAEAANTDDQIVLEAPALPSPLSRPKQTSGVYDHDDATHHRVKHSKKRPTNYKGGRQANPLPGCCG